MTAQDVLSVLESLHSAGAAVWISGGWGIDALAARQTREHRDLDLAFRAEQEPALVAALTDAGFAETVDWRPVRFAVTHPDGREIDLHPVVFQPDGSAHQASFDPDEPFVYPAACFTAGSIEGRTVPCLTVEQQILFHQGYEPADPEQHARDVAVLDALRGRH